MEETVFEGPEKKLEIILKRPDPSIRARKTDPGGVDARWARAATASRSTIVGFVETAGIDAYLLSESSLFVWNDRILMITCGKTTLIDALEDIFRVIDKENVAFFFFERKNFLYPRDQPSNFEADAERLSEVFPGKSYRLGPANADHVHVFYYADPAVTPAADTTFQILMHDLEDRLQTVFSPDFKGEAPLAFLDPFYPDAVLDDYQFFPFGFSRNAVFHNRYYTLHVTPQAGGSYASFETNRHETDFRPLLSAVISFFRPGKFTAMLTTSMEPELLEGHKNLADGNLGYRMTEKSTYEFDSGYTVTLINNVKES
jgi:S-adenosylmethionine decarboxylase